MPNTSTASPRVAIIGGGPAGLFAAEIINAAGLEVDLYEAKGSVGRKFLIAGKGGLNLTHSEPFEKFVSRYRERTREVGSWLREFDAQALRNWAHQHGVETYIGSSGRVFPMDRKAAPLLRGWVHRLKDAGVRFHVNHRWVGWNNEGNLRITTNNSEILVHADATVLALGGGSWPQLGSDGSWQSLLTDKGVAVAPLQPANCGFDIGWSQHFSERHAGAPLKPVIAHWSDLEGNTHTLQGECIVTETGIEGSLIYAISAELRRTIAKNGSATLHLDLAPGRDYTNLATALQRPRNGRSFTEHLRRQLGIDGVKAALLYEISGKDAGKSLDTVAATLKQLPLRLTAPRPLAEAISTAGGVMLEELDEQLMVRAMPGIFCAGEMLDWEAPTGGYLLNACFASGLRAARGAVAWTHRTQ